MPGITISVFRYLFLLCLEVQVGENPEEAEKKESSRWCA